LPSAQQVGKVYRIGLLSFTSPTANAPEASFRQGLRDLGWVDGRDIVIEARFAEGHVDRLAGLAAELVRLDVDVIVAGPTLVAQAARQATGTIPIVIVNVGDPIGLGFAKSLSHPGGNMTGLASDSSELAEKSLQLLREVAPGVTRIAVLINPTNDLPEPGLRDTEAAARSLHLQLLPLRVRGPGDFAGAFDAMIKGRAGAVEIYSDVMFFRYHPTIADFVLKNHLPTLFRVRPSVEAGWLMAYGPSYLDLNRRAAIYVDKILKGAKPAELPIEQPTKFDLVINLKTAKAIGLTIPQTLLIRADQIIE
jgi:putative ABC transport system substrate-binding protein